MKAALKKCDKTEDYKSFKNFQAHRNFESVTPIDVKIPIHMVTGFKRINKVNSSTPTAKSCHEPNKKYNEKIKTLISTTTINAH